MKRVGIFGGQFNPIHKGHVSSLACIQKQNLLDEIWVVPAFQSPGKPQNSTQESYNVQGGQRLLWPSPQQRLTMVQLATEELDNVIVKDWELRTPRTSYTVLTVSHFLKEHPDFSFYLIMGLDVFLKMNLWREWQALLHQMHFIVTSRFQLVFPTHKEKIPDWLSAWTHKTEAHQVALKTRKQIHFVRLSINMEISSQNIRHILALGHKGGGGMSSAKDLLVAPVCQFIQKHHLYTAL